MPLMVPMMSAMRSEPWRIESMVRTTSCTTAPPRAATDEAPETSWWARRADSAFCCTVEVSSSIEAAVSSRLLACSSVRWLRSALPLAICTVPVAMESEPARTLPTMRTRLSFMRARAESNWPTSSRRPVGMCEVRSPPATASATCTAVCSGRVMERAMSQHSATASTAASAPMAMTVTRPVLTCASARSLSSAITFCWWSDRRVMASRYFCWMGRSLVSSRSRAFAEWSSRISCSSRSISAT